MGLFCPDFDLLKWKRMSCFLLTFIVFFYMTQIAFSAGYQIPNQSTRAVGIAGATVAYTTGPDASYYNPANMSSLDDLWMLETSLAHAVFQRQPSFPIIVCTGHSESFTEDKAYAMGIEKYVLKPVLGDELMDAVREVLGS
ncbi:MAG: hypothetical protein ACI8PB_003953 [Desulforhopalus sp.]|jgi:hypothetical protein